MAGETHVTCSAFDMFRSSWNHKVAKAVSNFSFSESGRENCSSGRNDAPDLRVLGAKLRLHQVFWSQNLAFKSQNATMRPDFRALWQGFKVGQSVDLAAPVRERNVNVGGR